MNLGGDSLVISLFQRQRSRQIDGLSLPRIETRRRRDCDVASQLPPASQRRAPMKVVIAFVLFLDEDRTTVFGGNVTIAKEIDDRGSIEGGVFAGRSRLVFELENVAR